MTSIDTERVGATPTDSWNGLAATHRRIAMSFVVSQWNC